MFQIKITFINLEFVLSHRAGINRRPYFLLINIVGATARPCPISRMAENQH
ncbi:MAG: hypothetical protein AAB336_07775 [Acidobacteriota bacterium]